MIIISFNKYCSHFNSYVSFNAVLTCEEQNISSRKLGCHDIFILLFLVVMLNYYSILFFTKAS